LDSVFFGYYCIYELDLDDEDYFNLPVVCGLLTNYSLGLGDRESVMFCWFDNVDAFDEVWRVVVVAVEGSFSAAERLRGGVDTTDFLSSIIFCVCGNGSVLSFCSS
jgi:hypothetical protein